VAIRAAPTLNTSGPNPKGVHTVDPAILLLNIEAVTEGRLRTRRNLVRAVQTFLTRMATSTEPGSLETEILEAVRDNDDYGLAQWYFGGDGGMEEPFQTLRGSYRKAWDRVVQAIRT